MQLKTLVCGALSASVAYAQTPGLVQALNGTSDLSALTGLVSMFPDLVSALGSASNITVLAPSNEALNTFLNSSTGMAAAKDPGLVQAVL